MSERVSDTLDGSAERVEEATVIVDIGSRTKVDELRREVSVEDHVLVLRALPHGGAINANARVHATIKCEHMSA